MEREQAAESGLIQHPVPGRERPNRIGELVDANGSPKKGSVSCRSCCLPSALPLSFGGAKEDGSLVRSLATAAK